MAGAAIGVGHVPGKPEQFGYLHLRRNLAADIAQHIVPVVIDVFRLIAGAMIHPGDHVARRIAARPDGKRIGLGIEHNERTGRIEAHPPAGIGWQAAEPDGFAHRSTGGTPYIPRGMFDDAAGLMPYGDRLPGARQQPALGVDDAGPRTSRSDVDTDESFNHGSTIPSGSIIGKLPSASGHRQAGTALKAAGGRECRFPLAGASYYRRRRTRDEDHRWPRSQNWKSTDSRMPRAPGGS